MQESPSDFSDFRKTGNIQQNERKKERERKKRQELTDENKECKEKLFQNVIYRKLGEGVYGEVTECGPRRETPQTRSSKKPKPDDENPDNKNQCQRFALKKIAKKRTIENKEYEYPKRFWVNEYGTLNRLRDTFEIKSVPVVYDFWECPDYYYIKMQLLNALSLFDILTELDEGNDLINEPPDSNIDIIEKLHDFLEDVYKMNEASVYNNDLHTNNILWERDEKKFYMIDFGMTTFGEYYQHENNRDIVNDKNKQYADVVFVLAQLGENIKNDLLKRLPKNLQNVLQGGGKSIQKSSYKKKKRIIKINKKTYKRK